ncbi:cytochrome C [Caulobacter flavus]|uniref:Cytochrome C n=1 Tax=Caulobacter flavus TaxID=1679497 RepID=A0A2N5CX15_9CAUL|nr:cytochrome C [Caulobacter flavus]PLR18353.1 cytochrome C [Caulobacter flavus]
MGRFVSSLLALAALSACDRAPPRTDALLSADGRTIAMSGGAGGAAHACFSCHGLDGMGDGVSVPRLASLDAGYLQKQMEDYASGIRPDKVMGPVVKPLDDRARRAVALYYSSLPTAGSDIPGGAPPALWTGGDAGRGLAPCAACHGTEGQGVGAGQPALAGQPAAYTIDQFARWRRAVRRNDPRGVMTTIASKLSEDEVAALAAWLETQPASPAPASGVASASAVEAAAAGSAASREGRRRDR